MMYYGGKSESAREIARVLISRKNGNINYWEPFVGAGNTLAVIGGKSFERRYASDLHSGLIFMWQMLHRGWIPPLRINNELYDKGKAGLLPLADSVFIGFAGSYAGRWYAGYAKEEEGKNVNSKGYRYSHNRLMKKREMTRGTLFFSADFLSMAPPFREGLIYCDPPYKGTSTYPGLPRFNHEGFWERVRQLSRRGYTVMVSEYEAPFDFDCIWAKKRKVAISHGEVMGRERLFILKENSI